MSDDEQKTGHSASADAAALRAEEREDGDAGHDAPDTGPEVGDGVPNRHSASAEGASLRWQETHEDDDAG
jgi:hypothetical protein